MLKYILLLSLLIVRLSAAYYAIIPDCDEVFNYWEPLNFLVRFFGKQTWEYSPEFAIRSYAYLIPFAILNYPIKWYNSFATQLPSYYLFYLVRSILSLAFSFAEIRLSSALESINSSVATWFLIFQILSPGMYQASVSILPSSFALLMGILASTAVIRFMHVEKVCDMLESELIKIEETASKTKEDQVDELVPRTNLLSKVYRATIPTKARSFTATVFVTACGGLLGWPFSMVLIIPFVTYSVIKTLSSPGSTILKNDYSKFWNFNIYLLAGASSLFFVGYFVSQLDYLFYKDTVIVPYNIIAYNILNADSTTGPEIFGVEPPTYYVYNLLLNYHLPFAFAILNFICYESYFSYLKSFVLFRAPLLVWFVLLTLQPHKEERFMYPIYHLISISAAFFASTFTKASKTSSLKSSFALLFVKLGIFTLTCFIFIARTKNIVDNYSAPITAFRTFADETKGSFDRETVCIGREWYHYPSSFFLNSNQRLEFTESSFKGMLPSNFEEPELHTFEGLVNITAATPTGFNNANQYNPEFTVSFDKCDYYVDIGAPTSNQDSVHMFDQYGKVIEDNWELITCEDMIDSEKSKGLDRILGLSELIEEFVVKPWLKLQEDLSAIELNRKLMEMYGIKNPNGTEMFDGLYSWLGQLKHEFGYILGSVETKKFCVAKKL